MTWYFGLPSSSSHALIGGLVGAGLAVGHRRPLEPGRRQGRRPDGRLAGRRVRRSRYLLMLAILWAFRRAQPAPGHTRGSGLAQIGSASAMALGHGLQDAQKTMGVIVLALVAGGYQSSTDDIPVWVVVGAATAISLGTYSGGWRVMRTLGRRIIELDPPHGFAAETTAAARPVHHRLRLRRAHLDDAHDHLVDHGCRCHPPALRRALGGGAEHRRRPGSSRSRRRPPSPGSCTRWPTSSPDVRSRGPALIVVG